MNLKSTSRLWAVKDRQMIALLCFLHTIHYVISYPTAQSQQDENDREIPNIPSNNIRSWDIAANDKNVPLYASLIEILEKLEVLQAEPNSSSCVTLQKIVREKETPTSDRSTKHVTVSFHFIETVHSTEGSGSAQNSISHADIKNPTYSVGGMKNLGCNKSSGFSAHGLDSLSMKQESDKGANSVLEIDMKKEREMNKTGAVPMALEPKNTEPPKEEKGLSRTQVVVISTCSVVIGLFFLIAGALRLRNYYKRYRDRRESSLNANRRGSSLRLPGSNNSSGNLRRDSSCSKASRQSHSTVKSGSDVQIARNNKPSLLPHLSPALAITDQKPLLPVHSQLSQHSNGSSHGSIAYIDDDSSSKIKTSDVNDDGSDENEDFPLLRKSPDSGSYVSLAMETYKENNGETDDNIEESDNLVETEQTNENKIEEDTGSRDQNLKIDLEGSEEKLLVNSLSNEEQPTDELMVDSEQNSVPDIVDSFHSTDTDTDVANGFDSENIADSFAVNIGLNQSDSSISENPSYSYGNQTEYSPYVYDLGNYQPFDEELIRNYKLAFDCFDDSRRISSFLENENEYRENGTCDGMTNENNDLQLDNLNSPESLYSLKTVSGTDQTDSHVHDTYCKNDSVGSNVEVRDFSQKDKQTDRSITNDLRLVALS